MSTSQTLPDRGDVPLEQTWDLEKIYATSDEWEQAYAALEQDLPVLAAFRGRLSEGPETLLAFMQEAERVYRSAFKMFVYALLSSATDTTNQEATARTGQAQGLVARLQAAASFSDPEMMAIGFDTLRQWMQENDALGIYEHYVDRLEKREPHVRSPEVEEVLALAGDPLSAARGVYDILTNAELKFRPAVTEDGREVEVGQSSKDGLLTGSDRSARRTTFESYADGYLAFKNTFASTLTGAVKRDVFNMRTRNYKSSLEASLAPNLIPTEVFHTLIDTYKKNITTWHRYWSARKKVLGYEKLHWYDTVSPMTPNAPKVSFEQAVDWIAEGMRPLGDDYVEALRSGCLDERWVDWAVNKGKRQGAFSSGTYDTPPYILMSWADDLFSMSTLAHELGHSMHSYYSRKAQPFVYSGYSLFVAEVASNFNQAMTREHLFRTQSERDFQLSLIDEAMSNFRRYFFIMPTLARFELEVHERVEQGKPVNADSLNALCADLFEEGFGEDLEFDRDRMGIVWAQFGHLYMNFYVYQYATGISAAHALASDILNDEGGAAAGRYRDFLAAGGSVYPLDALKTAGVDMTTPEPIERAFETLAAIVDRLEGLAEN